MEYNTPKQIMIYHGSDSITLPVAPESFEVADTWNNEELNINGIGLITMIGKRGLKSVTISSFFPSQGYSFLVPGGTTAIGNKKTVEKTKTGKTTSKTVRNEHAQIDPWGLIDTLLSWRGKILTLFISGTGDLVSWPCVIDGDFTYSEKDGSGDVYYTLTLKEYKKTSTKRTVSTKKKNNTTLKSGSIKSAGAFNYKYTTKSGDTLKKIARSMLGDGSKAKTIYKQNQKAIDKGFKKYAKSLSKADLKKYKKKSKYNKPLQKGIKLTVKP